MHVLSVISLLDLIGNSGGGSSGGGADLASLDVYIADYLGDAPTITTGALDTLSRRIYGT